jgi:hypothetical protein
MPVIRRKAFLGPILLTGLALAAALQLPMVSLLSFAAWTKGEGEKRMVERGARGWRTALSGDDPKWETTCELNGVK